MSDTGKTTLTEREVSYHVATAGAEAKVEAAELGGDPAQMRGLVAAARLDAPASAITVGTPKGLLKGAVLRQDDLLVTLCLNLYVAAFGVDPCHQAAGLVVKEKQSEQGEMLRLLSHMPETPENMALKMRAIAALGFIFTQAEDAWELLDQATEVNLDEEGRKIARRDFIRAALEFGGSFTQAETTLLLQHVARLMKRVPDTDTEPGKQAGPAS